MNERLAVIARRMQWAVAIHLKANLDCFASLAMTRSWSLRGECNEPWQSTWKQIWIALLRSQWRGVGHYEANAMSRGNPLESKSGLLRFARNDGAELDCSAILVMMHNTWILFVLCEWKEPMSIFWVIKGMGLFM